MIGGSIRSRCNAIGLMSHQVVMQFVVVSLHDVWGMILY